MGWSSGSRAEGGTARDRSAGRRLLRGLEHARRRRADGTPPSARRPLAGGRRPRARRARRVIEEGLGGRTTIWDEPFSEGRNGRTYLLPCLESHAPVAVLVIMLGTNDLKAVFHLGRGRDRGGRREPGRPGPRQRDRSRRGPTRGPPRRPGAARAPHDRVRAMGLRSSPGDVRAPGALLPRGRRPGGRRASSMRAPSSRPIRSTGSTSTRPRTGCWVPPSRRRSTSCCRDLVRARLRRHGKIRGSARRSDGRASPGNRGREERPGSPAQGSG